MATAERRRVDPSLLDLTIAEASSRIARGEISPVALTEAALERIGRINSRLAAYITVCEKEAREAAAAAERMIAAGYRLGPLHGIPIALKDNVYTRGIRTTAGARILADFVPDEDATVTLRLKRAGAVIVGKTNMHEFAWGGTTDNPHYGTCRNPWNPERFPAGSSGGSGVAVAARTCLGALGTDTGGSIRLPSSVNGIVGIRPTLGRVSNHNVVPLAWTMDTVSPMTRTVEDCALMFTAIAGPDPLDPYSATTAVDDYLAPLGRGIRGLRIGLIRDYSLTHVQAPVAAALRQALGALERLGAEVVEVPIGSIQGNISAQLTIESCEPSAYHQEWLRTRPDDYGADVRALLEMGEMYLATHYLQAQRYRAVLRNDFLAGFGKVDVFVTPTLPFTATPCGATTVVIEDGREENMLSAIMQFTGVPSWTGFPAISIPIGFDPDGLPIGMQVIGRPFDEATLFRLGHAYQGATDWHRRAPPALD
jgi:aspartyl-tRNA(Asn)/glutamyl-tRNA(Gln) amidotransferase subunit A